MSTAVTLHIPEGTLGPAMRALRTDRQRAFIIALLDLGTHDATRAARAAGYADDGGSSIRVHAHRLMHDEKIQAAIQEEARRRMRSGSIMAVSHLLNIADNAAHKDQLKAIGMLLDRSGLHATSEHKVTVENMPANDAEVIARIRQRAAELGLDAKKLLGNAGVTDVEYEEVQPADDWSAI